MMYQSNADEINKEHMENLLKVFQQLNRLTGNSDSEKSVDYIIEELKNEGLPYERFIFDSYFSNPLQASLDIICDEEYSVKAKPRSFGGSLPEGVEGTLVYDFEFNKKRSNEKLKELFENKIVLSYNYYEDYVNDLNKCGALGLVHICKASNNVIFEETVGSIWGTPTTKNIDTLFEIPVLGIGMDDGEKLLEKLKNGELKVGISTELENVVRKCSLPICEIKGKSDDFVLISGHYDSWYEGISDNAVGNAICLEIARILGKRKNLEKSVKIAWWPGHSNGRYSGSTWYCDNNFELLAEKCIGHINIDSMGTKLSSRYIIRSAYTEGKLFMEKIITEVTGEPPMAYGDLPRGADMSFWGTEIPFHLSIKSVNPELKENIAPGSGGNWWWHTEHDTYDKADYKLMEQSVKIILATTEKLIIDKIFPFDYEFFIEDTKNILLEIEDSNNFGFDFTEMYEILDGLKSDLLNIDKLKISDESKNFIFKKIAGRLSRLKYSSCDRYDFDNTFSYGTYPGLKISNNINKQQISLEEELFIKTYFQRQKNRMIGEIKNLKKIIQHKGL